MSDEDETDETNYEEIYESGGRDALIVLAQDGDESPELYELLAETDSSLDNEDLGLKEDGTRNDDP